MRQRLCIWSAVGLVAGAVFCWYFSWYPPHAFNYPWSRPLVGVIGILMLMTPFALTLSTNRYLAASLLFFWAATVGDMAITALHYPWEWPHTDGLAKAILNTPLFPILGWGTWFSWICKRSDG